jgi:hypothetical protein
MIVPPGGIGVCWYCAEKAIGPISCFSSISTWAGSCSAWSSKGRLASLIRLSYLAPDIVRALLKGSQPIELTLTRLLRLSKDLPHEWSEQRHFLGFTDGRSIISGQNAR